jgi:hypothetical protein
MVDINKLLSQAAGPDSTNKWEAPAMELTPTQPSLLDQKKESVASVAETKKAGLGSSYQMAAGRLLGLPDDAAPELEQDIRGLNAAQLRGKYGSAATDMIAERANAAAQVQYDMSSQNPSPIRDVADGVTSVATGLGGALGGLASLGVGILDQDAGAWTADAVGEAMDWAKGTQSDSLQNRREVMEAANFNTERENAYKETIEAKTDGDFVAGLKRIGRDAIDSVTNSTMDGSTLADGTLNALGSLLAAGPLSKGVRALGGAVLPTAVKTAVPASTAAAISKTAPVLTSIGGIEAGGSYQQVVSDIMGRDHETLMAESPMYRELIGQNVSQEDAKAEVANKTGLLSAAITFPVAAATGSLVSKFEAAPFVNQGIAKAASTLLREPTEEAIQGGASQLAQNYAETQISNENKDLAEGVGRQVGEGALYGLGMTAITQGPGAAVRTGAKTLAAAGSAIGGSLSARADAVREANEAASPISDSVVFEAATGAAANAEEASAAMREAVATSEAAPEEQAKANSYIDKLVSAARFDEAELANPYVPEAARTALVGSSSRVEAAQRLVDVIDAMEDGSSEQLSASYALQQIIEPINNILMSEEFSDDAIPENSPAGAMLREYDGMMASAMGSPKVTAGMARIAQIAAKVAAEQVANPPVINDETVATPEGQQNVQNTIAVASIEPGKGDLGTVEQVLYQVSKGNVTVTPEQKAALDTTVALLRAARSASAKAESLGLNSREELVSRNIKTDDGEKGKSAVQFAQEVMSAWKAGNRDLAADTLLHLREFAEHMGNKVKALNAHFVAGNPQAPGIGYDSLTPDRSWVSSNTRLFVNTGNQKSIEKAQRIAGEAAFVADVLNGLADAFPDLSVEHIDVTPLDSALNKPASEIFSDYKAARQRSSVAESDATSTVVPEAPIVAQEEVQPVTAETTQETVDTVVEPVTEVVDAPAETVAPVATVAPAPVKAPTVGQGLAALFPYLAGKVNYFTKSFTLPEEPRTRTIGTEAPLAFVKQALSSSMNQAVLQKTGTDIPVGVISAYQDYLGLGDKMVSALQKNLGKFLTEKGVGERFKNGVDVNRWVEGKILNITEEVNGSFVYNQELVEGAVLAGLQWLLTADQLGSILDHTDVAEITGLNEEVISEDLVTDFNEGMASFEAVQSLAAKITNYWGVTASPDGLRGYTKGIPEVMASEILRVFADNGAVTIKKIALPKVEGVTPKTPERVVPMVFARDTKDSEGSPLLKFVDAIEQTVMLEPEETYFIGDDAIPPVSPTQMRNPLVQNTPQQLEAIENEQATPYYVDTRMAALYQSLGMDKVLDLFGLVPPEQKTLNINHAASEDGKYRGMVAAFQHMTGYLDSVSNYARNNGKALGETVFRYGFNISRVGRLQMLGKYSPQANKMVRELFMPTRTTLDMNQGKSRKLFMLAAAQALDIKVHKKDTNAAIAEAELLVSGSLAPAIEALSGFFGSFAEPVDANVPVIEASPELNGTIKKAFADAGVPLTPAALHVITELAWLGKLTPTQKATFTTNLYLEADGITNGPINAMMLFASGMFTTSWLKNMAKGGLFVNRGPMTANEQYSQYDKKDLYQATTDVLQEQVNTLRESLGNDPVMSKHLNELLSLMDSLLPTLSFDGTNLVLDRGITKNPLTITIYGSGATGIAAKLTKALADSMYEKMSLLAQARIDNPSISLADAVFNGDEVQAKKFTSALYRIGNYKVSLDKKKLVLEKVATSRNDGVDPQTYTLTPAEFSNIQSSMLHLFVQPMRNAIEQTVGAATMESAVLLRQATQVQSIILEQLFKDQVAAEMARKAKTDSDWTKTEFLSDKELKRIYKKLERFSPLIKTPHQTFYVAGSSSVDVNASQSSRALDGSFRTDAFIHGPKNAGVSGIPFLNIGAGDANMMQIASTMNGAPDRTLKIFDGVHLPLDLIQDGSVKMNEAVWETWMGNPMQAVADSYVAFMKEAPLTGYTDATRSALVRALFPPSMWKKPVPDAEIVAGMQNLVGKLTTAAESIEARHRVMAKVETSVDQMAAGASPYFKAGEIALTGMSNEEVTSELNALYQEELAELRKNKAPSGDSTAAILQVAQKHESGAFVMHSSDLKQFSKATTFPADQQKVLDEVTKSLAADGYKIVFGNPLKVNEYIKATGAAGAQGSAIPAGEIKGFTNVGEKTIYLFNPSTETLIHELIHASTFEKVLAYYNKQPMGTVEKESVQRIESMMKQFLAMEDNLDQPNQQLAQSYTDTVSAIKGYLNNASLPGSVAKAGALNEFMAWSLSNESLIRLGQRTMLDKMARIAREVVKAIKAIFFKKENAPYVGNDLFSNLLFNTAVVMRGNPTTAQRMASSVLYQNSQYGQDQRLTDVGVAYQTLIGRYLNAPIRAGEVAPRDAVDKGIMAGLNIGKSFQARGFSMTQQEAHVFENIITALATEAAIDPNAMATAQQLYSWVTKQLTVEHFMDDADSLNPATRYYAQEKFNSIMGKNLVENDLAGRSSLLPAFLALATVNAEFRSVLSGMKLPKTAKDTSGGLDALLTNAGNAAMDSLSSRLAGIKKGDITVDAAIDALNQRIADQVQNNETFIDQFAQTTGRGVDRANEIVIEGMTKLADAAYEKGADLNKAENNTITRAVGASAQAIGMILSEERGALAAQGLTEAMNKVNGWAPVRSLLNDLVGRTDSNAKIYDMIKGVRSVIQQARQQFREDLPTLIADKFTRSLSKKEWSSLFRGMGKTDLAVLRAYFDNNAIRKMLTDEQDLAAKITTLENYIQGIDPANYATYQRKMVQLAKYMNTGVAGQYLLRNAEAISMLIGQEIQGTFQPKDATFVASIDQLVTMYSLQDLAVEDKAVLAQLAKDETVGMDFALDYLVGQRKEEVSKATPRARLNAFKGHIPSEPASSLSMVVADDKDFAKLRGKSYVRVGDYVGSKAEKSKFKKGYYFAPVAARATFEQGIMQNVRTSVSGVDAVTGYSNLATAGRVTSPVMLKRFATAMLKDNTEAESLMPVFGENGELVAVERALDPVMMERMQGETSLAVSIGIWRGRQHEESIAGIYNKALVDAQYEMYSKDIAEDASKQDQYVDLFGSNLDPVVADAVSLLTPETRAHIQSVFGSEYYVRKDMLEDAMGYRSASIGDAWTGNTRWSPETQKAVQNLAISAFGNKAYQYLTNAERITNNLVSDMRVLIVVKSVVVPVANLMSNVFQLVGRGVPLANIVRGMPKKTAEIDAYVKSRLRMIEAEAELRAAVGKPIAERRLQAEIRSITDSHKRMSIWPLIQAGEFSSISDAGVSRDEIMLSEGRLHAYIENAVNKLPQPLGTLGRYALITKDTALFQGLQKAVEYGDFLGKALLYDDLVKRQGKSKEYALGRITEEFVNYDRLSGRFRATLENLGLLWFYNFKIRSTKVALSMIRNNPVHALIAGAAPAPSLFGSVGLPTTDNIFSKLVDGSLDYSIGPGQGLSAPELNPWMNLVQ